MTAFRHKMGIAQEVVYDIFTGGSATHASFTRVFKKLNGNDASPKNGLESSMGWNSLGVFWLEGVGVGDLRNK